ncbi:XkdQ/YqbQ family protein [Clostridium beijerinckii]|uniref:Lysozyme n=1 Tax=Clostridium beijerinckii TaxID=1520 RepID=A0AAE5LRJ3_CLOBE|nr:NlpC/P60 family protein [Clostridium beijerinckii]NSB15826.1 GH24 family phage-related lysozyme (muramidase)/cell wall-associated NlpC family hydrolase [Clostridium beijerinckii]OOM27949.1 putative endopeptidase YafL precursor [Clostridium beijerinckii]
MNDLKLQVRKWNDTANYHYIQDYCTSIKLSNSFSQIAAELSFEVPYATLSASLLALNIEMGDLVTLFYKETQIFNGKVIDTNLKGKAQTLSVNCYDYTWWVCKSNITRNFSKISVRDALIDIYKSLGASYQIDSELGDNGNIIIDSHLVKNKPASKVLYAIYSEVTKAKSGVYYYMHTEGDGSTLTITEADKYYSGLTIQAPTSKNSADGNLIDYEISESMQNMITTIEFHKSNGEVYREVGKDGTISLSDDDMGRFGTIQENIEVDDDDTKAVKAQAEGNQKLNAQGKPSEDLEVICIGDIEYQVAHGVMVKIPGTNYYDKFMYIVSSEWSWTKNSKFDKEFKFISKLTLSPSKNQNLTDWTDIEEKQDSNSNKIGASSDLVNRIIAELKRHLGLAYKWGGHSPADGGMDCSGYIAYVYNQFASELEIKSGDGNLYPQTEIMMTEGKDVTSDFPDNLRTCDIVFPHKGHVQAYIGNGKVIHSPQTGDVVKISDLNRNKIAKVIRVVPDSAWKTESSSDGVDSDLASSNLIEFIKGWEQFVSPAEDDGYGNLTIGYGTTQKANPGAVAQGTCTEEEATKWLTEEVNKCAKAIKNALDKDNVSLPQNQFDCLLDIGYNNGTGDLIEGNTWKSIINGEDKNTIANHILSWNHANGSVSDGLTKRCAARVRMFFDGVYDSTH